MDKKATPVEDTDIKVEIHALPSVFMLETRMPEKMVDDLNDYLDELLEDEDRRSLAHTLVGQIHRGEQLNMEPEDERLQEYSKFVTHLGAEYINNFMNQTGTSLPKNKQVAIDEIWSVHSYEGDYNPIHDHGTKTIMGLSTTCWTKVPQQILDQPTAGSPLYSKYNSSGSCDGYLAFNYGRNEIMNVERLRPPQSSEMQPEVGKLLLFPSWLQHMVYPFFGDGERRTVASNLNCWDVVEET
jgi:hypothetical protein